MKVARTTPRSRRYFHINLHRAGGGWPFSPPSSASLNSLLFPTPSNLFFLLYPVLICRPTRPCPISEEILRDSSDKCMTHIFLTSTPGSVSNASLPPSLPPPDTTQPSTKPTSTTKKNIIFTFVNNTTGLLFPSSSSLFTQQVTIRYKTTKINNTFWHTYCFVTDMQTVT